MQKHQLHSGEEDLYLVIVHEAQLLEATKQVDISCTDDCYWSAHLGLQSRPLGVFSGRHSMHITRTET